MELSIFWKYSNANKHDMRLNLFATVLAFYHTYQLTIYTKFIL
jgi:hypothetical protein